MTSKKPPSWNQIRNNARRFATRFRDACSEKSDGHEFMRGFLEVFGVDPLRAALYEQHAKRASKGGALGFIDMLWPSVLNHRRLHGELRQVPPAEFEANHWSTHGITHYVETPTPTGAGTK